MPCPDKIDVLFLNWRDATHPEGGGSERYVHRIAEGLAARGARVTLLCAAHGRAPREEDIGGVRVLRRGGRYTVYLHGLVTVLLRRPRLVVDVQNGVPFASTLVTRRPVVVLVHHVHREQWPILFGRLRGAVGWWLESRVAPRIYRRCSYVTVSDASADELAGLGVDRRRITLVRGGADPVPAVAEGPAPQPRLIVLGRLVPHKRIEHALAVLARLRDSVPGLALDVVGDGWWAARLRVRAAELGVADRVTFHGFVDEQRKHELLACAWLQLCPSVKEGWGLVVIEAAGHGVPTVAYRSAGGLRESVLDGRTGVLADDLDQMVDATRNLLADHGARRALGAAAVEHASTFDWASAVEAFAAALRSAAGPESAAVPESALAVEVLGGGGGTDRVAVLVVGRTDGEHGARPEDSAEQQRHRDSQHGFHLDDVPPPRRPMPGETVSVPAVTDNVDPLRERRANAAAAAAATSAPSATA